MARSLGLLFWKDLEQHHPGISSLRLDAQTAAAWKERVSVVPARGNQPARPRINVHIVLNSVRASVARRMELQPPPAYHTR